jgi:hypothetical protein
MIKDHLNSAIQISIRQLLSRTAIPGLFCFLLLPVVQISAWSQQSNPPTNGLVAWWKGDGNGNDSAGTNNGAVASNVGFVPGISGQAFSFPGLDPGLVVVPDYPDLALTNSLSMAAWVNMQNNSWVILTRGNNYTIGFDFGGRLQFSLNNGAGNTALLYPTNVVPFNRWTHVAATLDGSSGDMRVYINGNLVGEMTTTARPALAPINCNGIGIGAVNYANFPFSFNGYVDQVLLYSRVLTAPEVAALATTNCIPHAAMATATVVNGFVVSINLTEPGCGYTNTPQVAIIGGGGINAAAFATVSNGIVTGITLTSAGIGYTNTPMVVIGSAPVIGVQPQSITVNAGDNATFTVTDVDVTPAAYQWTFDGANIPGANASTLTISNVSQTALGTYAVDIVNPFGSVTSSNAVLSMYPFLQMPFEGAVTLWGTNVTFSVGAVGSGPLSYQWFINGMAISDATNSTLNFPSIQFTDAGVYTVVVSNPYGSTTNAPVQVVVNPAGVSIGLYPGVTISGVIGNNYTIQRASNLIGTNPWVTVGTITLTAPVQLWLDTNVDASLPANSLKFYRVLPGP